MTLEDQIAALLAQAQPLRLLPDDEAEAKGLPGIVDKLNALLAKKNVATHVLVAPGEPVESKRKPGKPKVEGEDA